MKRYNLILVILLAVLMSTTFVKAQNVENALSKESVKTLVKGINSDNAGLTRSSIYMAGKYRVTEAVDALVEKMTEAKDPNTRILIALSLYEIRDPKGLEAVKEQSLNDLSDKVKNISAMLYAEYVKSSDLGFVSVSR